LTTGTVVIELQPRVLEQLAKALPRSGGFEICGFLLVDAQGRQEFRGVRNLSRMQDAFTMAEPDVDRVLRLAKLEALDLAAIVHSHRYELTLSSWDEVCMTAGKIPWIVVALRGEEVVHRTYAPRLSAMRREADRW
jgi:proteasome lid subunit RPN8/RPN11